MSALRLLLQVAQQVAQRLGQLRRTLVVTHDAEQRAAVARVEDHTLLALLRAFVANERVDAKHRQDLVADLQTAIAGPTLLAHTQLAGLRAAQLVTQIHGIGTPGLVAGQ